MLTASLVQNFKRKKNWYLWKSVTPSKKTYPYYAKFWFFLGILTLGWMTPVTRYWEEFILWEKTDAYPIRQFNQFGVQEWKYVYKFKGRNYTTGISGGPSARRVTFLDLPEGLYIPPSQRDAHWVKERYTRTKVVQLPPRDQTIQLYVNPQLGKDFFYPNMEYLYTDENLFFPVALQIGMIAFFIAVRYK